MLVAAYLQAASILLLGLIAEDIEDCYTDGGGISDTSKYTIRVCNGEDGIVIRVGASNCGGV